METVILVGTTEQVEPFLEPIKDVLAEVSDKLELCLLDPWQEEKGFVSTLETTLASQGCRCVLDVCQATSYSRLIYGLSNEKGVPYIQYYPILSLNSLDRYMRFSQLEPLVKDGLGDWSLPLVVCLGGRKEISFTSMLGERGHYENMWSWGRSTGGQQSVGALRQSPMGEDVSSQMLDEWMESENVGLCILEDTGSALEEKLVEASRRRECRLLILDKEPAELGIILPRVQKVGDILRASLT